MLLSWSYGVGYIELKVWNVQEREARSLLLPQPLNTLVYTLPVRSCGDRISETMIHWLTDIDSKIRG